MPNRPARFSWLIKWLEPLLNPMACLSEPEIPLSKIENAEVILRRLDALLQQPMRMALPGERRGIMRGQGLDFSDFRVYTPGDDIRKMDWSVFARTLIPHVREYHEDKQLTLWLALDMTSSMHFGRTKTKVEQAIELMGLLGLVTCRANHQLGAFFISERLPPVIIPPKAGKAQLQRIMKLALENLHSQREMPLTCKHSGGDPLSAGLIQLGQVVGKYATVMVFSDFLTVETDPVRASVPPQWQAALGELSRKCSLISLLMTDPVEFILPGGLGLLDLIDSETGLGVCIDTRDPEFLSDYTAMAQSHLEERLRILRRMGRVALASSVSDPVAVLMALIAERRLIA